jgi:hypothetical protein
VRTRSARWAALAAALACLLAACSGPPATSSEGGGARVAASPTLGPGRGDRTMGEAAVWPYLRAVREASAHGLRVWLDADLARRWLAGRAAFDRGVARIAVLARLRGVVGVKIADELAYQDGFDAQPERVLAFLRDARTALRRAAPGKLVLIDLLVPALGCVVGRQSIPFVAESCLEGISARYPALNLDQVDRYLASGTVDVVDLSTGLLDDETYRSWGTDRAHAQVAAWEEVRGRGWPNEVTLQSRKALAHAGRYTGDRATAEDDVRVFVDIPVRMGAAGVDVWTWRQEYRGAVFRLMDPGLRTNELWKALERRRARRVPLLTELSPSSVERSLGRDLSSIRTVFSAVFVAAGVG